jgi:glycosyltransferase involved in cell wall biosynthesis
MNKDSVLFYTQNQWAFGQIHHALIKRLYAHGIYAHLLDFYQNHTQLEFDLLKRKFETFVTTPEAVVRLMAYGVEPERIVTIAHAERDVVGGANNSGSYVFDRVKAYAVINPALAEISKQAGISREPVVVRNGLDFDHFYAPISKRLVTVGYAGASHHPMSNNTDCKRSYLVSRVLSNIGLQHYKHPGVNHLCMAGYYETVDAILVTSNYEACGLPAMEAAAAGRLVVAPNVGYFDGSTGVLCRMPDDEFVFDARLALIKHKNSRLYRETCERAQQYARDNYDWSKTLDSWLALFS